MLNKSKLKKGITLTEILVAFTIFVVAIFSVVYLYYSVLRINTNASLAEAAMQNLDIICSYVKFSPGINFQDTLQ